MAANIETMFYTNVTAAGERYAPWHGLGVEVDKALDSKEALEMSGLNWKVISKPVYTKEGIETSRLNGSQIGHPVGTKLVVKKAVNAKKLIKQHSKDFDGTLDDMMCMKIAEVSRNSFYKYKKN